MFVGAAARERERFQRPTAAMRVIVDPPILRDELLEFLRGSGCLAFSDGGNAIETQLLVVWR